MNSAAAVEITFFVPAYNEAKNIASALFTVKTLMTGRDETYEILAVDDGSTDGTSDVVQNYMRSHAKEPVTLVCNPTNLRLGTNYVRCAEMGRGKYYMLVNGDNDTRMGDYQTILSHKGRADMVVPYVANQNERPFHRNLISRGFNLLVSLVSGHRLKYYNGPVLHLRENVVRFAPKATGFTYQAEILCKALCEGGSYVEVPLYYVKDPRSRSSAFSFRNMISVLRSLARIAAYSAQRRLLGKARPA